MPAKVICMASAKGGSGKTMLTATFGTFLAAIGKKILLIDADAATNGLTLFFLKETMLQAEYATGEGRQPKGSYEVNAERGEAGEVVKLQSGVHLLPATYRFINTGDSDSQMDFRSSLGAVVAKHKASYDYIFLDAQAGSEDYAQAAISRKTSDEVVIVSEYDPMSAAGIERLKGFMREDLGYPRTWILLNKLLPEFVQSFSDFLEIAKYLAPIPWNAEVVRAYARRRLALDLENGNEYTVAVAQTLRALIGDEISVEISAWENRVAAAILLPLDVQYRNSEGQLKNILIRKSRARLWILLLCSAWVLVIVGTSNLFVEYVHTDQLTSRRAISFFGSLLVLVEVVVGLVAAYFGTRVIFTGMQEEKQVRERLSQLEEQRAANLSTLLENRRKWSRS